MPLSDLMSLSDEKLRQVHRRRMWIGLLLLVTSVAAVYAAAQLLLESGPGPQAFTQLLALFGVQGGVGLIIIFWMTRPMNERDRRKRLVMRQAIGAFPGMDD